MATLVKRQHFVPRTYLKNFGFDVGEETYINVLPSSSSSIKEVFESNIINVALKKHLYTLSGDSVEEKMAIESFYSDNLEAHYSRIYSMLIDDNINEILKEDRELIITTVVTMYYRTTWWINKHYDVMNRVFAQMFEMCKQMGTESYLFEDKRRSIAGQTLEEHLAEYKKENQPSMVIQQLEVASKLISLRLKNDRICVYKLENDKIELLTSDNPVTATNILNEQLIPFDADNILSLPLDSKHILYLIPDNNSDNEIYRTEYKDVLGLSEIQISNTRQVMQSEKFVFGSYSGIENFLKMKEEKEKFKRRGFRYYIKN
ncbi:DUF4238 domain-containing protein [Geofilum sp. OHC36d9]|uniref:DUF4238 domain-containing protein n=1 Tax=Geofilum sp. OHC36d9 TaxID=3458413 RepID=UPI004034B0FF